MVLCRAFLRMQCVCALQTLPCTAPRAFSLRTATETQALSQQRQTSKRSRPAHPDTNPIVPGSGFLQVAVSEAPPTQRLNSQLFAHGRFRYSTKTSRYRSKHGVGIISGHCSAFRVQRQGECSMRDCSSRIPKSDPIQSIVPKLLATTANPSISFEAFPFRAYSARSRISHRTYYGGSAMLGHKSP